MTYHTENIIIPTITVLNENMNLFLPAFNIIIVTALITPYKSDKIEKNGTELKKHINIRLDASSYELLYNAHTKPKIKLIKYKKATNFQPKTFLMFSFVLISILIPRHYKIRKCLSYCIGLYTFLLYHMLM